MIYIETACGFSYFYNIITDLFPYWLRFLEEKMKDFSLYAVISITLMIIGFLVVSCEPIQTISPEKQWEGGTQSTLVAGTVKFNVRYIPSGSYYVGANPVTPLTALNVSLTEGYWISETEVTYKLWYEVITWASTKGYSFSQRGKEGNTGVEGAGKTSAENEPVTGVSWRNCVLWCNALSQRMGLPPVYYTDAGLLSPLKTVTDNPAIEIADQPYIDSYSTGFRLPTEAEWEIAARGATKAQAEKSYGYPYSGSTNQAAVAWYILNSGGETQKAGTRAANQIGLFDMSGNVREFCFEDGPANPFPYTHTDPITPMTSNMRIYRGGCYNTDTMVDSRAGIQSNQGLDDLGFRPVSFLFHQFVPSPAPFGTPTSIPTAAPTGLTPGPTTVPTAVPTATPTGSTPNPTVVPTATPTGSSIVVITAAIQGADSMGSIMIAYQITVAKDGSPYNSATVTVQGPHGTTTVPGVGGGGYLYSTAVTTYYQAGSTYTVKVNIGGTVYSDSIVASGGITISATQASWTSEGNKDMIMINNSFTDGPDIASPYNISSHLSSGANTVSMVCTNLKIGQFSNGADATSMLGAQYTKMVQINK
jgi:sulfatase modifying factor 1